MRADTRVSLVFLVVVAVELSAGWALDAWSPATLQSIAFVSMGWAIANIATIISNKIGKRE